MLTATTALCLALTLSGPVPGRTAESRPDDELLAALVERARLHAEEANRLLSTYTFEQHSIVEVSKPKGKVTHRDDRRIRIVPTGDGAALTELLEVDGRPPTKKELAKNEKENRKRAKSAAKRERRHAAQSEEEVQAEDDGAAEVLEILSRTRYEFVGTEESDGRELVGLSFEPPEVKKEKGVEGKFIHNTQGTVWLDLETGTPVRAEAGAADKFRLKGLVGVKDFSWSVEQLRVNEEIWLPSEMRFDGLVSFLGMKRRIHSEVSFSNYRKATVSTIEERVETPDQELERILEE